MNLSPNFELAEFEKDSPVPAESVAIFKDLATLVLEPIRAYINRPITITSGYRTEAINEAIHGAPNSEHVATAEYCAADFIFDTRFGSLISFRMVFDWIRMNRTLPFHQVILEHGRAGTSIIHISINSADLGEREALEGATYNMSGYSRHDVALYAGVRDLIDFPVMDQGSQNA